MSSSHSHSTMLSSTAIWVTGGIKSMRCQAPRVPWHGLALGDRFCSRWQMVCPRHCCRSLVWRRRLNVVQRGQITDYDNTSDHRLNLHATEYSWRFSKWEKSPRDFRCQSPNRDYKTKIWRFQKSNSKKCVCYRWIICDFILICDCSNPYYMNGVRSQAHTRLLQQWSPICLPISLAAIAHSATLLITSYFSEPWFSDLLWGEGNKNSHSADLLWGGGSKNSLLYSGARRGGSVLPRSTNQRKQKYPSQHLVADGMEMYWHTIIQSLDTKTALVDTCGHW